MRDNRGLSKTILRPTLTVFLAPTQKLCLHVGTRGKQLEMERHQGGGRFGHKKYIVFNIEEVFENVKL